MTILHPKLILSVAAICVVLLLISLAQETNRRLQVQREVQKLQQEVQAMQKNVIALQNLNQYFRTDAYQERLAREKLNYQAPGEQVVLIPEEQQRELATAVASETAPRQISIPERWWRAFFAPELLNADS